MKRLLPFLTFLFTLGSSGQYFSEQEISRKSLTPLNVQSIADYAGLYKFGFSEDESELMIIVSDSIVVAQVSFYTWDEPTGKFNDTFRTFTGVRIVGNKFFSDQTNGEFVIYKDGSGTCAGLLVYSPWSYKFNEGGEFGPSYPHELILPGKYPFASTRFLTEAELEKYSPEELKIIRNEIFARYGMIFQKDGPLDVYFSAQDWYRKNYVQVNQWLTLLELANIETIKNVEKKKSGQ